MRFTRFLSSILIVFGFMAANVAHAIDLSTYNGQELFMRFCASCHGSSGVGDGPVASSLTVMVPDLTMLTKRHGGEFPAERIHQIIDGRLTRPPHGTRNMPVWGWEFVRADGDDPSSRQRAEDVIQRMVEYLRSIQKPIAR